MFKDNLITLRNINGYSQEEIAEKIGISRQAYSRWENGSTIPDIEKCAMIADIYGISIDNLFKSKSADNFNNPFFAPKDKNIWGSVTINDRGQIVIPKEARKKFNLMGGNRLIVLSDDEGIALVPAKTFEENIKRIMELAHKPNNE